MEVIRASHHTAFSMDDASRVGEARRHAATLAVRAGLDDVQTGRLAIVVTELGNNLVNHAVAGVLMLAVDEDRREVEAIATDRGPGMRDLAKSMTDGFSTGGTPGTGLGAVRRLTRDFHVHSVPGEGTLLVARMAAQAAGPSLGPAIEAAAISVPLAGEYVCGDAWAFAWEGPAASVLVADGLGHGPDAAEAAQAAVDTFARAPFAEPAQMLAAVHARLRSTRGAAVTVLRLDAQAGTIRACGAGNVTARIVSGASDRTLLSQHGTAGLQMRRPEETRAEWPPHAVVVLHTDGIESRWAADRLLPLLGRDPALAAALLMRDHSRGRDDATACVVRRAH